MIVRLAGLLATDTPASEAEIVDRFTRLIEPMVATGTNGAPVTWYRRRDGTQPLGVFPFVGAGFWDAIHGFVALDPVAAQIRAIDFTQHGETPGLGGRISEPAVQARFRDRPCGVADEQGRRVRLVPEGTATKPNEIDAITGATETSRAVERILNDSLPRMLAMWAEAAARPATGPGGDATGGTPAPAEGSSQ